jgi:hypothetical protein
MDLISSRCCVLLSVVTVSEEMEKECIVRKPSEHKYGEGESTLYASPRSSLSRGLGVRRQLAF